MMTARLACSASLGLLLSLAAPQPGLAAAADPLAPIGLPARPAPPPKTPVTETLQGITVTDDWRGMETLGPATLAWMRAQGRWTRTVLDAIAPLSALQQRVAALTGSFGLVRDVSVLGGRTIYERRAAGADAFDLVVGDAGGTRTIVSMAARRKASGGRPGAINFILPSPDGSRVAAGISEGGSEDASIQVYDTTTGAEIAGPIDRAQFGATSWSDDGGTLYFVRLKQLGPNDPGTEKYRDPTLDAWTLNAPPTVLYGATAGHGPHFGPDETPALTFEPGAALAVLTSNNGVQNEIKLWTAPAAAAGRPDAQWTPIADRDDGITNLDFSGHTLFLMSHRGAPTFQVLELADGAPLARARVLVPAQPDRVIENLHAARDGLYVVARRGAYSELLRVPAGTTRVETVRLPTPGHVSEAFSDPRVPGIVFALENWVTPPTEWRYDPATGRFTDLGLGAPGAFRPASFAVHDISARAHDGTAVPLTLITPQRTAPGAITVVEAYGSYGISELADFSPRRVAMLAEGISYAVCHVRGGGELGETWRLGGKDANKHNTWQDLIACGQSLVAGGTADPHKLFILGGSAGGITVGRAMTERPDLFAGAIDAVPVANTLRTEFSPNGPDNVPEFGSVTTEAGVRNLLADDSIAHVKPGIAYPAVLISTGLNDPRVAPWQPAKFAAALEAAGDPNPVLLRIDEQAGHGIGSTRSQTDALTADWIAFVKWRAGDPAFRPRGAASAAPGKVPER